jgi:hypothetical protein
LAYLPATRASLAAQTFGDYEVLVLDNACDAVAQTFFRDWAAADARVRILRVDQRIPMFPNFRRGLDAAVGEYIAFFHDDDEYHSAFLARLVDALERHPTAGFSGSNWDFVDKHGRLLEKRRAIRADGLWLGRDYVARVARAGRNPVPMPGLVFRREVLARAFDERITPHFGDFVVLMKIAETWDVAVVAESLMNIRKHEAQASTIPHSRSIPMRTELLLQYCEDLAARCPQEAGYADGLRQQIQRAHTLGLVWAWLASGEASEADACIAGLGSTRLDHGAQRLLAVAPRLGLTAARRQRAAAVAKKIGARLLQA